MGTPDPPIRFAGLELVGSPLVMTPRATSEALAELAVAHLADGAGVVADVGTGSGAVAIAIARAAPHAVVWATDVSSAAVDLARENARRNGVSDSVRVRKGDLLAPVPGNLDVVVANLPYLPSHERPHFPELWVEPASAVFAEGDGLGVVRRLVAAAARRLKASGLLVLQLRHGAVAVKGAELGSLDAPWALLPADLAA